MSEPDEQDVDVLADVLRDADELAYANIHADWARQSIARTILASGWYTTLRAPTLCPTCGGSGFLDTSRSSTEEPA